MASTVENALFVNEKRTMGLPFRVNFDRLVCDQRETENSHETTAFTVFSIVEVS
jgi:hypothetical protein